MEAGDILDGLLQDLANLPSVDGKSETKYVKFDKPYDKPQLGGTVSKPSDKHLRPPEIEVLPSSASPLPFLEGRSPIIRPGSAASDTTHHSGNEDPEEVGNFQSYHLDYKYTPPPIKGPCCVCGSGIMGAMVTALDKMWHPEHFCCVHCGIELRSPNYTEHDGKPYCKACHNKLFLPPCYGCNKDIIGQYVTAMGAVWHPECFRCTVCHVKLPPTDFYEKDGKPYCEDDYHDLFSPKCHGCKKPIKDGKKVSAMGKLWHPEHFRCTKCDKQLSPHNFKQMDGKPYCIEDFNDLFMPKCAECRKPILTEPTLAMGKKFHPDCFNCTKCKKVLNPNNFFEKDGKPYCEDDFHKLFSPKCAGCQNPVKNKNKMVKALGKPWHPEHFKCTECGKILSPDNFFEKNGLPYCEDDFHKLFSPKCAGCTKPIKDSNKMVKAMGKTWHPEHFNCSKCGKVLSPNNYFEKDGVLYCEDDFHKLFSPKCAGCQNPIKDQRKMVKALGKTWHPEHFNCAECGIVLHPDNFFEMNGLAYCEDDFHKLFSHRCGGCGEPIRDNRYVHAMGNYYHPEHFTCCFCGKQLPVDAFYEKDGKAYCVDDFLNLFAPKCKACRKPITDEYCLAALDGDWHPNCFRCMDCNCLLEDNSFFEIDGQPYCETHYHARQCPDCLKLRRAQNKYWGWPEDTDLKPTSWASQVSLTNLEVNQVTGSRPSSRLSQTSTLKSIPIEMENGGRTSSPAFSSHHDEHSHFHNGHHNHEFMEHTNTHSSHHNHGGIIQQYGRNERGRSPSVFESEQYESSNKSGKFPVESEGKHIRFQTVIKKQEYKAVSSHVH